MKNTVLKVSALIASVFVASLALANNHSKYSIDASHSTVGFSVTHMMITNVKGQFNKYEGGFEFDSKKNEVKNIDIKVDIASVDTNDKKRDEHLVADDFFAAAKFPQMTFKADKAVVVKQGQVTKIPGTLTMRGVSKPVSLDVEYKGSIVDPWGNEKVGFFATTKINRKDYGVSYNKTLDKGGLAVGEEVTILIDGQAVKAK